MSWIWTQWNEGSRAAVRPPRLSEAFSDLEIDGYKGGQHEDALKLRKRLIVRLSEI